MPFSPYREERDQSPMLLPKQGWECDISSEAPVVYRDKKVVARQDFDNESKELVEQAETLRDYADALITNAPNVAAGLESAARKTSGGDVGLNFTTLLPRLQKTDSSDFARQQLPVLNDFADRTDGVAELKDYHRYYRDNATGLKRYLERMK